MRTLGADIINCSWGSSGYQQSEHEVIKEATNIGACIVAACGNDNANAAFYPAAYPEVLSVASVNQLDGRSGFSNFHTSVDVSAPDTIISTVPVGTYDYNSGTSMASPTVGTNRLSQNYVPIIYTGTITRTYKIHNR